MRKKVNLTEEEMYSIVEVLDVLGGGIIYLIPPTQ